MGTYSGVQNHAWRCRDLKSKQNPVGTTAYPFAEREKVQVEQEQEPLTTALHTIQRLFLNESKT